jgi:glucokinase
MANYCFGADIGGTTIKLGLFAQEGTLLEHWEIPTRKEKLGAFILSDIWNSMQIKMQEKGIEQSSILGIGIGAPGPVSQDGVVHGCINLGWEEFNLAKKFQELVGPMKIKVGNDAKVAALGEYWKGVCKGTGSMLMITLGTGIGGAVILNGKILMGANGAAGEIGHLMMSLEEKEFCNCGKKGCLEQIASATGMVRTAQNFMKNSTKSSLLRKEKDLTAKTIFDVAKAGDSLAQEIVEYVSQQLGIALANVSCVVDTDWIVIGGGVSNAGMYLLEKIDKYYNQYVFHSCQGKPFTIAHLGNLAGIYGCAKMVLEDESGGMYEFI